MLRKRLLQSVSVRCTGGDSPPSSVKENDPTNA
jgi:hypothetical protein